MNPDEILAEAQRELEREDHRKKVDAAKAKLRSKRPLWERLFPFVITITRRK